jgi:hypothetical protein
MGNGQGFPFPLHAGQLQCFYFTRFEQDIILYRSPLPGLVNSDKNHCCSG